MRICGVLAGQFFRVRSVGFRLADLPKGEFQVPALAGRCDHDKSSTKIIAKRLLLRTGRQALADPLVLKLAGYVRPGRIGKGKVQKRLSCSRVNVR